MSLGAVLTDSTGRTAVERAANVVKRDQRHHHTVQHRVTLGVQRQVAQEHHRSIYTIGFTGVDGVVDEKNGFTLGFELGEVKFAVFGIQHQVQGETTIGRPFYLHVNFFKISSNALVPGNAFFIGWCLSTIAGLKTGWVLGK